MDQLWRMNFKEKARYDDVPFPAKKISVVIRHFVVAGLTVWGVNGSAFAEEVAAFIDLPTQQQNVPPAVHAVPEQAPVAAPPAVEAAAVVKTPEPVPAPEPVSAPVPETTEASRLYQSRAYSTPPAAFEPNSNPDPGKSFFAAEPDSSHGDDSASVYDAPAAVYDTPVAEAAHVPAPIDDTPVAAAVAHAPPPVDDASTSTVEADVADNVGAAKAAPTEKAVEEKPSVQPEKKRRRFSNLFGLLGGSSDDAVEPVTEDELPAATENDPPVVIAADQPADEEEVDTSVATVPVHDTRPLSDSDVGKLYQTRYEVPNVNDEVASFRPNPDTAATTRAEATIPTPQPVEAAEPVPEPLPVESSPVSVTAPPPPSPPVRQPTAVVIDSDKQQIQTESDISSVAAAPRNPTYPVQSKPVDTNTQGTNQRNFFNLYGLLGTGKGVSPADGVRASTSEPLPVESPPAGVQRSDQQPETVSGYVSANEYYAKQAAEKTQKASASPRPLLPNRNGYDSLVRDIDGSSEYSINPVPGISSYGRDNGVLRDAYAQWLGGEGDILTELEKQSPVPETVLRNIMLNAVEQASTRSPQITQVRAEWEASQYDVDEAKGRRLPQVQVGGVSKSWGGGDYYDDYPNSGGLNVSVTTSVYDFGYNRKNIQSRKEMATAGEYKFSLANEDNAYQVCSNLVELSKNKLILEVNRVFVKRMQTLVNMLADIVKVDGGRASELTQARARLLQAQTAEETVAARVRDIEIALRKLVGPVIDPLPSVLHWDMPIVKLEDAIDASRRSSAILQLDAEAQSAETNATAVWASTMPKLNWMINKSTVEDSRGEERDWETSLAVSWDIFQGGSGKASERAARSRAAASIQRKEQLLLDSEFDLRQAHHDAVTNYERSDQYRGLSSETARVRQMFFEQWYHLGKRTLLDVLTAENDHNSNQVGEITTKYDAYQSVLKMYSTSGSLQAWLRQMN